MGEVGRGRPLFDRFDDGGRRLALTTLRQLILRVAGEIGAPPNTLPTYGSTADFGRPHIQVDWAYHWIVVERGEELERRTTVDLDQLMYWVFSAVTFSIASDYEVAHRQPEQDSRRLLFSKHLELLGSIRIDWRTTLLDELQGILTKHPFADSGPVSPFD